MSALVQREEYRGLEHHDCMPPKHVGVIVRDRDFEPHLRIGEVAVVDTADQSIEFGELYVLRMNIDSPNPRLRHLAIVQLTRDDGGLWYAFSFVGKGGIIYQGTRLRYADGPLRREFWPEKCLGRIVGYMAPL